MRGLRFVSTLWLLLGGAGLALGQPAAEPPDTNSRTFRKVDLFPAISYAPETKLTLGVVGYRYFDFYRGDPATRISNVNFLAVYTTAKQISLQGEWDLFTNANRWRFRGKAYFDRYPDRNYGRGNDAAVLVNEGGETYNYLRFNSDRLAFAPVVLRRVGRQLYLGVQVEIEHLGRLRIIPDDYAFLTPDSGRISRLPVEGTRSGIGGQLLWDTRDNILNPRTGTFLELGGIFYLSMLGSDYVYQSCRLDARQFINPTRNHTLALRGLINFRFSGEAIPLRGLSQVGGMTFVRGYFKGTYQDNHLAAFELEYRMPFWRDDLEAPFWRVWKRQGVVGFLSGAQVFSGGEGFAFDRFNLAAGGGLRILFNRESRVNLRLDYALGLRADSGGPGKRQSGFYFYLAEAF